MIDVSDKTQRRYKPETRRILFAVLGRAVFALLVLAFATGMPLRHAQAAVTPTLVQMTGFSNAGNDGKSSYTSALPSKVVQGDLIAVGWFAIANSASTFSVSDTLGNAYAPIGSVTKQNTAYGQLFYAKNVQGGYDHITCTMSQNGTGWLMAVHEYAGLDTISPLDVWAYGKGTNSSMTSGATTTHFAVETLFAAAWTNNTVQSVGSGFTERQRQGGDMAADRTTTSAGSYAATMTGNGTNYLLLMAAFKGEGPGPQANSRSDALSNSQPSATSNHSLAFTAQNAITGSSTVALSFPSGFAPSSALDCGDVDAATSSQFNFNYASCAATATAWGFLAQPNVSIDQQNNGTVSESLSNTEPFVVDNRAGNLIIVSLTSTSLPTGVTDTRGNAYVQAAASPASTLGWYASIWYAANIKAGANTVTVNFATQVISTVFISEYRGLAASNPLDVTSSAAGVGTIMDSGAKFVPAGELIFGRANSDPSTGVAGSLFAEELNASGGDIAEYRIANSSGTYSATTNGRDCQARNSRTVLKSATGRCSHLQDFGIVGRVRTATGSGVVRF